jgi:hypothetical protein
MPPRRSGKAASRRARQQRRSRRATIQGAVAPRPPAASPESTTESSQRAASPSAATSLNPRPFATGSSVSGSSRLGEAARAEYHYVGRDLRNTGLLVLLMAALLAVAVIVVNLAGIAPS